MYATIRRYRTTPSSVPVVAAHVAAQFVPLIRQSPGFVDYLMIDTGDGTLTSISIFEDRDGAEKSNELASSWAMENFAPLFPSPPEISGGEVVARGSG